MTEPSKPTPDEIRRRRVDDETDRLRIRRAARRRVDAEDRPPVRKPEVLTLRQRLARPRPPVQFRISGWQPAGSRVMLSAQYKAGKTTLIGNLGRSLLDGDPWLGTYEVDPVAGTVAVLDTEMSAHALDAWYADIKIRADDRVIPISLRGNAAAFDIIDDRTRAQWAAMLSAQGCAYLVLDPLRPVLDALGLDEWRDAGRFLTAFDALLAEAGIGEALVAHHMGHTGERSRGDSRLRDWPDVEWRLVRADDDPSSPRYIAAYGRDVEITESRLTYDPASRRLAIGGGSRKDAAAEAALDDIVKRLSPDDPAQSGRQIEKTLLDTSDHTRAAIRAGLKLGLHTGRLGVDDGAHRAKLYYADKAAVA
jgi:hypothetical protein